MKKLVVVLVLAVFIAVAVGAVVNIIKPEDTTWKKVRVADDSLYPENYEYVDYKNEVFYDENEHPALADQGLFWIKWDEEKGRPIEVPADSEEGAALVDPNKPTLINIHGMLVDGATNREDFFLNPDIDVPSEFDVEYDRTNMLYLWIRAGYNVANFQYHRFATDMSPPAIEGKIWLSDSSTATYEGQYYQDHNKNWIENASEYTVSEHFVGEYLRAMSYLPDTMGDQEIHVVAHSMGGEVAASGLFLLTEMAAIGRLDPNQLPNRYTLMDTYFSMNIPFNDGTHYYVGPKGHIRWSGKELCRQNTAYATISCLEELEANGIVMEYYYNDQSFLNLAMSKEIKNRLLKIAAYVEIKPDWSSYSSNYAELSNGHNGVREWYLCSKFGTPAVDTKGNTAPSAGITTERLKELKGKYFRYQDGITTINAQDDVFVELESLDD